MFFVQDEFDAFKQQVKADREELSKKAVEFAHEHRIYDDEFVIIPRESPCDYQNNKHKLDL
jgi:hypothetical protein